MGIAMPIAEKTVKFPLPVGVTYFVYLITENGIFKTDFEINNFDNDNPVKRKIFNGCQNVLKELRNAQLKEKA
jgi:hypothetical protein